jgi:hypothetical protein
MPLQINPLRVTDPRSVSEYATFAEISPGIIAAGRMSANVKT